MAKIIILIEDSPGNKVRVESTPSFETMMKMDVSGADLTSAHGYAFCALNAIRDAAKRNSPLSYKIPKIIRPH